VDAKSIHLQQKFSIYYKLEFCKLPGDRSMGAKTPLSIRKEIISRWLKGHSRDQIAKEVDIGAGTVSSIIKEYKQNDQDFDPIKTSCFHN
jgi:hypothetical protein